MVVAIMNKAITHYKNANPDCTSLVVKSDNGWLFSLILPDS